MRSFAPGEGPGSAKTINAGFRRFLETRQKAALMARADCYVSLGRSEGFGPTLAESGGGRDAGDRDRLATSPGKNRRV